MRIPPHDLEVEADILSMMATHSPATLEASAQVSARDFYDPRHARMFTALVAAVDSGEWLTPSVLAEVADVDRGVVSGIYSRSTASIALGSSLGRLAAHAENRRWIATAGDISEAAYRRDDPDDIERRVTDAMLDIPAARSIASTPGDEWHELINDLTEPEYDWLVPGVIERGERFMLTGTEGAGKSELLWQMAVMFASGIHPWTRVTTKPVRVLAVDCENTRRQVRRRLSNLIAITGGRYVEGNGMVHVRPAGINLRDKADERWLDSVVREHKADVLTIGPLYKMFASKGNDARHSEDAAVETAAALDRIRDRYGVAILIEAHSPHGSGNDRDGLRPYGASLWLRWPEYGVGLKPLDSDSAQVVAWRGHRDASRFVPTALRRGSLWPWEVDAVDF